MKIPGWIYILVGVLVSMTSSRVQEFTESQGMILFFWVGIIMIVIGVAKTLIGFIIKHDEETIIEETKKVIHCKNCKTKHYITSNYCHKCGTKLEK